MGEAEFNRREERANAQRRLKNDSDRGAALVLAAFVEEELELCLQRHFITTTAAYRDRMKRLFRPSGPLGSFSVKIDVGWLMGAFGKDAQKDLVRVKDIRNAFAHQVEVHTFDHPAISGICASLAIVEKNMVQSDDGLIQVSLRASNGLGISKGHRESPIKTRRGRYTETCWFLMDLLANTFPEGRTHKPHF